MTVKMETIFETIFEKKGRLEVQLHNNWLTNGMNFRRYHNDTMIGFMESRVSFVGNQY